MQYIIIGIGVAVFFFVLFSLFLGKSDKKVVEEINQAQAEAGKPTIKNEKKGKLIARIVGSCAAGAAAGLIWWIISMVF